MKFWKGNRADAEFDWPVQAVADAFCAQYTPEDYPLERSLRYWLTSRDGFNSVWEAEEGPDSFDELFEIVRKQLRLT